MDSDKYCYEVMWQWFFSHFIKHLFPLYLGKFLRPPRQPAEWMEHSSWVGLQVSWLTCKWKLTRSQYATQSGCTGEHGGQMFAETAPHRSRAGAFMGLGDTQLFLSKHISICTCPALWLVHLCTWCFGLHLAGYCAQILIFFFHTIHWKWWCCSAAKSCVSYWAILYKCAGWDVAHKGLSRVFGKGLVLFASD